VNDTGPKTLGLTIKDLNISGSDGSVYQIGIFVNHSNQLSSRATTSGFSGRRGVDVVTRYSPRPEMPVAIPTTLST
jgi:hypothetical protein